MELYGEEETMRAQNKVRANERRNEKGPHELLERVGGVDDRERKEIQLAMMVELSNFFDAAGVK
jgi:hypothetical protein